MPGMCSLTPFLQKRLFRFFGLALVLFACLQANVRAGDYEIEVIVFERPDSEDIDLEHWNFSEEHLEQQKTALEEMRQSQYSYRFTRGPEYGLTQDLEKLDDFVKKLENNNLSVLAGARWIQPAFFFQNAPVISLGVEGSRLSRAYFRIYKTSLLFADMALQLSPVNPVVEPEFSSSANLPEAAQDMAAESVQEPENGFDDEYLFDAWPEIDPQNPQNPEYFLIERRRVRFGEVHYFDHPAFGVILGVWSRN